MQIERGTDRLQDTWLCRPIIMYAPVVLMFSVSATASIRANGAGRKPNFLLARDPLGLTLSPVCLSVQVVSTGL